MAAKKVGTVLKEARTEAGLTQEQLAKKITGVSAADISKTERGEKDLTQAQLKQAAKALGITQASLLNAPKNVKASASSSSSSKKTTAKKTASTGSGTSMKLTAAEKKLVEYYRDADANTKKAVVNLLKSAKDGLELSDLMELLPLLLGKAAAGKKDELDLGNLMSMLTKK